MEMNRQWLLAERPSGMVGPQNLKYTETPSLKSAGPIWILIGKTTLLRTIL